MLQTLRNPWVSKMDMFELVHARARSVLKLILSEIIIGLEWIESLV